MSDEQKDQLKFDLNRMTRKEFREFFQRFQDAETGIDRDQVTGEILEKVLVSWPYDQPMTLDGYLSLGLIDSKVVDNALEDELIRGGEKK